MSRIASPLVFCLLLGLAACGDKEGETHPCDALAEHIADLLASEKPDLSAAAKTKAVKDLAAACKADEPKQEEMDCALAAKTRAQLEACDPKDPAAEDAEDEKEKKAE